MKKFIYLIFIFKLFYLKIVHKWTPCHREALKRSHVDKTIVLLKIGDRYVPIVETAVQVNMFLEGVIRGRP